MSKDAEVNHDIRDLVDRMVQKLVAAYSPEKIILFGSYAHGDPAEGGDIDLLIIKETTDRFLDRCVTVRRILSDPERMVPIDTLVLTPQELDRRLAVGDQFIAGIVERGKVVYAARGIAVSC